MQKTRKHLFAEYLAAHSKTLNADGVRHYSGENNLGIQVKTINSEGDFVIKFNASDPWVKPSEWLHNYKTSVQERYKEAEFIYHSLFSQEDNGKQTQDNLKDDWLQKFFEVMNLKSTPDGMVYPADKVRATINIQDTIKRYPKLSCNVVVWTVLRDQMRNNVHVEPQFNQVIEAEWSKAHKSETND